MYQLTAPNAICGRVIGRGGSKINSITVSNLIQYALSFCHVDCFYIRQLVRVEIIKFSEFIMHLSSASPRGGTPG